MFLLLKPNTNSKCCLDKLFSLVSSVFISLILSSLISHHTRTRMSLKGHNLFYSTVKFQRKLYINCKRIGFIKWKLFLGQCSVTSVWEIIWCWDDGTLFWCHGDVTKTNLESEVHTMIMAIIYLETLFYIIDHHHTHPARSKV